MAWQVHEMAEPGVHEVVPLEGDDVALDDVVVDELEVDPPPPLGSTVVEPQPRRNETESSAEARAMFMRGSYSIVAERTRSNRPSSFVRRPPSPCASSVHVHVHAPVLSGV